MSQEEEDEGKGIERRSILGSVTILKRFVPIQGKMGMENGHGNDNKPLEPNPEVNPLEKPLKTKHNDINDDKLLEGTVSGSSSSSSSPLASPSASSSSSFEDQSPNPEPQSPSPASLSYPDISTNTSQWSMISASPSNSTRLSSFPESNPQNQSPPIHSTGQPACYDPNRIPISIFGSRSNALTEWSVASTESLFSIHMGNNSFSRDHAVLMNKSGELTKPEDGTTSFASEAKRSNDRKSFSSALPPVIEGAPDNEEKSNHTSEAFRVQESNAGSPKSVVPKQNSEDNSKIAASSEVHLFAMSPNTSEGRGIPPALNPPRLSDESGTSSSSFAFPVLVNDGGNATSLNSVREKPGPEQKPQPESQSRGEPESTKEEVPKPAETSWLSYLFCLQRCC